eukprot:scaffold2506_cov236-Pinguiococcus_pyrenoidosus.AAC.18
MGSSTAYGDCDRNRSTTYCTNVSKGTMKTSAKAAMMITVCARSPGCVGEQFPSSKKQRSSFSFTVLSVGKHGEQGGEKRQALIPAGASRRLPHAFNFQLPPRFSTLRRIDAFKAFKTLAQRLVDGRTDHHRAHQRREEPHDADEAGGLVSRSQGQRVVVVVVPLDRRLDALAKRRFLVLLQDCRSEKRGMRLEEAKLQRWTLRCRVFSPSGRASSKPNHSSSPVAFSETTERAEDLAHAPCPAPGGLKSRFSTRSLRRGGAVWGAPPGSKLDCECSRGRGSALSSWDLRDSHFGESILFPSSCEAGLASSSTDCMLKEDGDRTVLGLVRESVAHSPRSLIESRLGPESSISGSALPPAGAFSNGTGSCPKSSDRARSTPSSSDRSSSVRYKVSVNAWNSRAVRLSKREISFIEAMPPWRSFSCRPGLRWCRSIQLVAASRSSWRSHSRSSAASALSSLSAATANTLTTDTMLTTTAHTRGLEELGSEKTFPRALTAAERDCAVGVVAAPLEPSPTGIQVAFADDVVRISTDHKRAGARVRQAHERVRRGIVHGTFHVHGAVRQHVGAALLTYDIGGVPEEILLDRQRSPVNE